MADRSELCADVGHPGVTYNEWENRTWCICGLVIYRGRPSTVDEHLACCGGPLSRRPDA